MTTSAHDPVDPSTHLTTLEPEGEATSEALISPLLNLAEKARVHAASSMANNTRSSYDRQWRVFTRWCTDNDQQALPADPRTVALFLEHLNELELSVATLSQSLAAIAKAHRRADLPPPQGRALDETWAGIRRERGVASKGKAALLLEDLRRIIEALPLERPSGVRDRALLLVGFAGAFRRSELISLRVEDLEFEDRGVVIHLVRGKTDQEARGRDVGIPNRLARGLHPPEALRAWLELAKITEGPLFRSVNRHGGVSREGLTDRAVALVVQRSVKLIGLDPVRFSGHSLRSGLVTSAAQAGKSLPSIMAQTGHQSVGTVQRYVRRATLFDDSAASELDF